MAEAVTAVAVAPAAAVTAVAVTAPVAHDPEVVRPDANGNQWPMANG